MIDFLRDLSAGRKRNALIAFSVGLFVASLAAQELVGRFVFADDVISTTAFSASATLGLLNGRGLTLSWQEVDDIRAARFDVDLLTLYRPQAERVGLTSPLPGTSLILFAVAKLFGGVKFDWLVHGQYVLHALLSVLLFLELRHRWPIGGLLAGLGWAFCLPQYRLTHDPGYDALASFVYVGATVAILRYHRTGSRAALALGGFVAGAGLWIRSFVVLFVAVSAAAVGLCKRPRLPALATYGVPLVLMLGLLTQVGPPTDADTGGQIMRRGFWYTWWCGVAQFPNDVGIARFHGQIARSEAMHVKEFAAQLDPSLDIDATSIENTPEFNAVLREAARSYAPAHVADLVRNTIYRIGWLLAPSTMPSQNFKSNPTQRLVVLAMGLPISLLALLGAVVAVRRDAPHALFLASAWISLLPLATYYFVVKVPTTAFFVQVSFAAIAVETLVNRFFPPAGEADAAPTPTA